ncbi:MAG TPA: ABC transporter ATP-binding protein [Bacteroidales bacterium]|nr:ABC transporter ATP-binding protein [Bacteroidales bacterium]HRZ49041.1 ABC transporter ATP-binding protein [Bacteroidales bacterium]
MIETRQICKSYGTLQVLKGIDLDVARGEIISVVGASGAGKTTLLQIIGTLDRPDSGTVKLDGTLVNGLRDRELARFRNRHIGFIFQFHHLLPEFSALENVCMPAFIARTPRRTAETRAMELLEVMGVSHRSHHKPSELSGGEAQRIAVARALINQPSVVLADEPSGNLDSQNAQDLHTLFFSLRDMYRQTFVIVTHNEALADLSDRKLVMKDGLFQV